MRRTGIVIVVLLALAGAYLAILPARAADSPALERTMPWPIARGAYHVHSTYSDGTGTFDEIADAAARAGLQFVIITDHGDGTRRPEAPRYRSGVLVIDAVEVSTNDGHLTALSLRQTPYRLAGDAREVIEDVHRLGGFAIAAHPGSPKPALRWTAWDTAFDGLEWLNADSEWRDEMWGSLGRVLLTYGMRPAETLATLVDRPAAVMQQWDARTRTRHTIGIAGADAHARLGLRSASEPYQDRVLARVPSYEASFRAFANHVVLNAPLNGDPVRDAHEVLDGVRRGRVATSIDGLARMGGLEMMAVGGGRVARIGEYIDSAAGVEIKVRIGAPAGTTLELVRDGTPMYEVTASELSLVVGADPASYRVEAHLPGSSAARGVPWLVTNPIYVNLSAAHRAASLEPAGPERQRTPVATAEWRPEASAGSHSALSRGTLPDGTPVLFWKFDIARDTGASPYAAIRFSVEKQLTGHHGLQLRAEADRPMRIWAQLRAPGGGGGRRWIRSVYLERGMRQVDLLFDEFRAVAESGAATPIPLGEIDSLLLVADTVNTAPGTAATIAFSDLWLLQ